MNRFQTLLLAFGLVAGGLSINSSYAEDSPGQHQAGDHDHGTMKMEEKISKSLASLSPEDRKQAEAQRFCPIMERSRLGAMGAPIKVTVAGKSIFVCCKGCVEDATAGGEETLKKVQKLTQVSANLAKLPADERAAAEAQKYCAIADTNLLGAMGTPISMEIKGKSVFLCCKGCVDKAKANPDATLAKVEELKNASKKESHDHSEHDAGDDHDHEH